MKKIKTTVIILILVALVASFIPMPLKIDRSMKGVGYDNDGQQEVNVEISGWYFLYLLPFKDNYFIGDFKVGDINCHYTRWARLTFSRTLWGWMFYYDEKENRIKDMGNIREENLLKKFSIFEKNEDGEMVVISAPATTKSEAKEIYEELFYEFR